MSFTRVSESQRIEIEYQVFGKTLEEARILLNNTGIIIRIWREDSNTYPMTTDYRPSRMNVAVQNGKICSISWG